MNTTIAERQKKDNDALWLARCVWTETKDSAEMVYVAWAIRNRVDTKYRGDSYEKVVLSPWQFSAFNTNYRGRNANMTRTRASAESMWMQALDIAKTVVNAPVEDNAFAPFTTSPSTVRHYFSPQSMTNGPNMLKLAKTHNYGYLYAPVWYDTKLEVKTPVTGAHFRFFKGIK